MHNYIYELLQVPVPADEWAKVWEYHEHPGTFPIAITPELEHRKSGYVERKRRPYQGNLVRIA